MSHFMPRAAAVITAVALLMASAAVVSAATAFSLQLPNATGSPGFVWYMTDAGLGGFDLVVSGTFRCDTAGSPDCTASSVDVSIHATNNAAGVGAVLDLGGGGGGEVKKLNIALGTGGSNTPWNTTFQFRTAPGAGQWGIPPDNTYEVKALFKPVGGDPNIEAINNDAFGVDNANPTSTIDAIDPVDTTCPQTSAAECVTADGTATDPGAAKTFSGFAASQSPKSVRVQLLDSTDAVVDQQFLALNPGTPGTQTGGWSYEYAGVLDPGEYCVTSRATDRAANAQDPVTTTFPDSSDACFTVDSPGEPDTVFVTTEVRDQNESSTFPFDLGAIVHDIVTILTSGGSDVPGGSSVDFEFNTGGDCGTLSGSLSPPVENVGLGPDPVSSPVSASSSPRGPLHAGDYSYKVHFNSGLSSAVSDGEADCEPFSVAMGATTTATTVHNAAHSPVTTLLGGPVHDEATVDVDAGVYDGFSLNGLVTFTLYDNLTCDGNVVGTPEDVAISGLPPQSVESSAADLASGSYSYQAEYSGNADYSGSTGDCEPFTIAGLYLHNNPTPPTGNTNAQANLPLDGTAPTASTLYNYALSLDSNTGVTGRFIDKAPSGEELTTTDLQKYQTWRTAALASDLVINGDIDLTIWAKMKAPNKNIDLRAFLLECTSTTQSSCTLFATGDMPTLFNASSTSFQQLTVSFANVARTIDTGNRLQLRVVMLDISNADPAYLAYDTTSYPARLASPV